ncbi:hypothetical protein [Tunturibacter empetritectus]|uniref:Uncharacterized protein n=1 Tax=Tunturiibacter empetritectus TaxID=3069691 RepID=A0A7W8IGS5_9BACT|nr:hypothetical protein [Edaphobacter lichenicola]MBB5316909.1 hypothetical protein [Edaphobacter lichenicola]
MGLYVGVANLGPIALAVDGRADLSSNLNSGLIGLASPFISQPSPSSHTPKFSSEVPATAKPQLV